MTTTPHDALFKATFGQPDIAQSELELVLPPAIVAHLDLRSLEVCAGSFVDEELRSLHTDLLYVVRSREGAEVLVYVVCEHQSSVDATMPFRMLKYMVRVWDRWLRDHPDAKTLPVVLPMLMHHGEGRWTASTEFTAMLKVNDELAAAVRPYQPQFRIVLDDLTALSLDGLATRTLHALGRMVQLAFWGSRTSSALEAAAPLMGEIAHAVTRDARTRALLEQIYLYLWRAAPPEVDAARIRSILLEVAGPQGREDVMNAAEQLIAEGRQQGLEEGLRTGVLAAISARNVALSEIGRARINACTDMTTLTRWLTCAVTANGESDVFVVGDSL